MLTIRQKQFKELEETIEENWLRKLVSRLRQENQEDISTISEEELYNQVVQGCQAARELNIVDDNDIYRFIRLRYLPDVAWTRLGLQEVFYRIIFDNSVDASQRLDFIERNLGINN
jgi:hypothetical protein